MIDAVRVPPSAWMTSQSIQTVRSPSAGEVGHRAQRSADQPLDLLGAAARPCPCDASRWVRVLVARGSIPYPAVTQPLPVLRRKVGTRSSTLAVQMTLVLPALNQHRPFGVHQIVRA